MSAADLALRDSERNAGRFTLTDRGTVYLDYGGPDPGRADRRRPFMLSVWSEGFHLGAMWTGQCFFCDPAPIAARYAALGRRIEERTCQPT